MCYNVSKFGFCNTRIGTAIPVRVAINLKCTDVSLGFEGTVCSMEDDYMRTVKKCMSLVLAIVLFGMTVTGGLSGLIGETVAKADSETNEQIIYEYCSQELGFNTAACCGILANIQRESWFLPYATGDNGAAYGICQWNSRRQDLINYCSKNGYDYTTVEGQLAFLKYELTQVSWFSDIYDILCDTENTAEGAYWAAYYFSSKYEIPVSTEHPIRGALARDTYWPKYSKIVDPTITAPTNDAQLDAANPGSLKWSEVPGAKSYRYTILRVNSAGEVLKTVASNVLVSSTTKSVSLSKSSNSSLTEALLAASSYKVTVIAYSDTAGSTALGSGASIRFTTKSSKLSPPSLTSPVALTPTQYSSHYAATSTKKVDPYVNMSFAWSATGDYYKVDLVILSESPNPSKANERGTSIISGKVTGNNNLTVSASTLTQYAGKYLRLKIVALSNSSGIYESAPVYYYFERTKEISGYTLTFVVDGGKVDNKTAFVQEGASYTVPKATSYASSLVYNGAGGRCIPEEQDFYAVNTGWSTTKSGTDVTYKADTSYTFTSNTTLFAVWKSTVRVSTDIPVRSGYDFLAWQMYVEGEDDAEIVQPGTTITRNDCKSITLTAVWSKNYEPTIIAVRFESVPEKNIYEVGEEIDLRGLVVRATYSNNSTALISDGLIIKKDSVSNTGVQTIVVDCEGHTLSFTVYVLSDTSNLNFDVGDVDMDQKITAADARITIRTAVGLATLNSFQTLLADPDDDGIVRAADARRILRASVGLEDTSSWKRYALPD